MSTALSVNVNKIALLRNSRDGDSPSVIAFSEMAIDAGARGITVHPRPDKRHIRPSDVLALSQRLQKDQYSHIEFNIEGNPFEPAVVEPSTKDSSHDPYLGFMALVEQTRPHQATLVPDNSAQLTSDHGFDMVTESDRLRPIITQLHEWGVRVSLFMDPDIQQIERAKAAGADRIEFYTGPYADAYGSDREDAVWQQYHHAAVYAHDIGLGINAGHDLNLDNLERFLHIPHIAEVSIGHALTVDALLMGYKKTVAAYGKICNFNYTS